jgi:uncharacterized membrane protein
MFPSRRQKPSSFTCPLAPCCKSASTISPPSRARWSAKRRRSFTGICARRSETDRAARRHPAHVPGNPRTSLHRRTAPPGAEKDPRIGFTTVYRTLKLLAECGLASEVAFHDGIARYEHQYNRRSHHHMVCTECGSSVEFFSQEVERIEQEIGRKHHYLTTRHTFQIYGICEDCRKKSSGPENSEFFLAVTKIVDCFSLSFLILCRRSSLGGGRAQAAVLHPSLPTTLEEDTCMAFCSVCGAQIADGTTACAACASRAATASPVPQATASTGGMTDNVAGMLAYITIIPAIIFLVMEPYNKSRFVRFHAWQNIFLHVAAIVIWIILMILTVAASIIPIIGHLIVMLLGVVVWVGFVVVWIILVLKANQGQMFKFPVIGDLSRKSKPTRCRNREPVNHEGHEVTRRKCSANKPSS